MFVVSVCVCLWSVCVYVCGQCVCIFVVSVCVCLWSVCVCLWSVCVCVFAVGVCMYVLGGFFCFESVIYNPLHAARRAMAAAVPLPLAGQRRGFYKETFSLSYKKPVTHVN